MITREFLEQHVQRMNMQIAAYQGALEFAEMLLKEFDGPLPPSETMTLAELQAAIERGAQSNEEVSSRTTTH